MASSRSLLELGDALQSSVNSLYQQLKEANIPQPSFTHSTSPQLSIASSAIQESRLELIEILDELRAVVLGPEAYIFHTAMLIPSWTATFSVLYNWIPETIQPGDVFNAAVEQLAGIPLQYSMLFGIETYDEEWSVAPRPGSLGSVFMNAFDLQVAVGNGSVDSNTTLSGLSVPEDFSLGRAAIQAVIFEIAGPINTPLIETWWWSVNISDTTSEKLVWSSYAGENSRICQIPMEQPV